MMYAWWLGVHRMMLIIGLESDLINKRILVFIVVYNWTIRQYSIYIFIGRYSVINDNIIVAHYLINTLEEV